MTDQPKDQGGNVYAAACAAGNSYLHYPGISLRDHIAVEVLKQAVDKDCPGNDCKHLAVFAYQMAEAMLNERENWIK